jgi:arabinofuranan 3-O-arabinosyltransferase
MLLERRPMVAGVLLGALVAKPQMALLVPVALIAGRRWSMLIAGGTTAAVLIALSAVAFGTAPWRAFVAHEPILRRWLLEDGTGVWFLFASVFVSIRHLPTSLPVAYAAQALSCLLSAGLVAWIWISSGAQSAKNAALVAASLFATPYFLVYDLVAASLVPLWLLPLLTRDGSFRNAAWASFAALLLAPLLTPIVAQQTGVNIGWLLLLPSLGLAARLCNNESKLRLA